jgi:hypothetical protein
VTDEEPKTERQVSAATLERREKKIKSQLRQKRLLKRMIFAAYGVLIVLIGLGVYDRVFSWDVADHTDEFFTKADFVGQHTADPVLYEQVPPVGGPHARVPQACGFYSEFVHSENAVHSMEHGAVWITYDPALSGKDLDKLKELATQPYVLVTPYPGLPDKIVVSSWGHQMVLGSVDEKKINAFRSKYGNNKEYTPEFTAPCGTSFTEVTSEAPQQDAFIRADLEVPALGGVTAINATATAQPETLDTKATPLASPIASPEASPVPAR